MRRQTAFLLCSSFLVPSCEDAETSEIATTSDTNGNASSSTTPDSSGTSSNSLSADTTTPDLTSSSNEFMRCVPGIPTETPLRPAYDQWLPIELPGTKCGDGTPYRFFVRYSRSSSDVMVTFEPGGACWSFATCSATGTIAATTLTQAPLNYLETSGGARNLAYPLLGDPAVSPTIATGQGNQVFLPYCTGDSHLGNFVATYINPDNQESIEIAHVGASNVSAVIEWMSKEFRQIPRLTVAGCSAGSLAALLHYATLRQELHNPSFGESCGTLLADSGPVVNPTGNESFHLTLRALWNANPVFETASLRLSGDGTAVDLKSNSENIYAALSRTFEHDHLALSLFRMDLTMPAFLYVNETEVPAPEELHRRWDIDVARVQSAIDRLPNWNLFLSDFRADNCSHCTSIIPLDHAVQVILGQVGPFFGTEIPLASGGTMHYGDFVNTLFASPETNLRVSEARDAQMNFTPTQLDACKRDIGSSDEAM